METYLEALERLGKLRDAGVLTKEEFDAEKAHLLHARPAGEQTEVQGSKWLQVRYIIPGLIAALLLGGGISYLIFKKVGADSQSTEAKAVSSRTAQPASFNDELDLSITFADASKCEPGPSLADLLGKIRDAASSDEGSVLRLIRLTGSPESVEVQSSVRNFGPLEIRLGSLLVSQTWQGLHLTELRTIEWDGGNGFQLRFSASPENLLRVVHDVGFPIKTVAKSVTNAGAFEAIEKVPGGAVLTCMKSNKAGQASTVSDVSVNETGE